MASLRGDERTEFPQSTRKAAFKRCCRNGVPHCETCGIELRSGNIVYEHVDPDALGGEPTIENCKVHCRNCAHRKTVDEDMPRIRKADRVLKKSYGLERTVTRKMPFGRRSMLKRKINGQVVRRDD
jgi:5-methylcytosine-specific restriction endonuclease McrA